MSMPLTLTTFHANGSFAKMMVTGSGRLLAPTNEWRSRPFAVSTT